MQDPVQQRHATRLAGILTFTSQGPRALGIREDKDMLLQDTLQAVNSVSYHIGEQPVTRQWV